MCGWCFSPQPLLRRWLDAIARGCAWLSRAATVFAAPAAHRLRGICGAALHLSQLSWKACAPSLVILGYSSYCIGTLMQYLSFNEAAGGRGKINGLPEEDSETQKALLDPMPLKDTWVLWEQA
ncbi:unnamed protein product, partial [Effrenium voratum]